MNVKESIIHELHKPARKNFQRRYVTIKGLHDLFQADLLDLQKYSRENERHKYLLIVIDCFSKFLYAYPLKTKTGKEVSLAFEKLFKKTRPKLLQTDAGTEFYNSHVQKVLKKYNVKHYSTFSNLKAQIAERVIRTFRSKLSKVFHLKGSFKWLSFYQDIVKEYNNTKHSTIKMCPNEVSKKNESHLLQTIYNYKPTSPKSSSPPLFQVDDFVRVSKYKGIFAKPTMEMYWSPEIFQIRQVQQTNPITYLLRDAASRDILGSFYSYELLKTKHPDTYLIEKVLKKTKDKVLVKWLGFKNPSYVRKEDVLE